jgi:hypothetical protein
MNLRYTYILLTFNKHFTLSCKRTTKNSRRKNRKAKTPAKTCCKKSCQTGNRSAKSIAKNLGDAACKCKTGYHQKRRRKGAK